MLTEEGGVRLAVETTVSAIGSVTISEGADELGVSLDGEDPVEDRMRIGELLPDEFLRIGEDFPGEDRGDR